MANPYDNQFRPFDLYEAPIIPFDEKRLNELRREQLARLVRMPLIADAAAIHPHMMDSRDLPGDIRPREERRIMEDMRAVAESAARWREIERAQEAPKPVRVPPAPPPVVKEAKSREIEINGKTMHLGIINPLKFKGEKWSAIGSVLHPLLGPIDLYEVDGTQFGKDTQSGVQQYFMINNSQGDDVHSWAIKFVSDHDERRGLIEAFAAFQRNKLFAAEGLGPPCKRMVRVTFKTTEKPSERVTLKHYWGYQVCRCNDTRVDPTHELRNAMQAVDLRHTQDDFEELGYVSSEWYPGGTMELTDCTRRNCGMWKGSMVCFDFGRHTFGRYTKDDN